MVHHRIKCIVCGMVRPLDKIGIALPLVAYEVDIGGKIPGTDYEKLDFGKIKIKGRGKCKGKIVWTPLTDFGEKNTFEEFWVGHLTKVLNVVSKSNVRPIYMKKTRLTLLKVLRRLGWTPSASKARMITPSRVSTRSRLRSVVK